MLPLYRRTDISWPMPDQQEQRKRDTPERNKLRVRAGHTISLSMYSPRPLLLDQTLEGKVESLAG